MDHAYRCMRTLKITDDSISKTRIMYINKKFYCRES